MALKVGSLFSGIGGFDLGFERVGCQVEWQIEIGKMQQAVLAKHWPAVKRYTDIRRFTEYDLTAVDIVCGGDPCPKHSHARSNGPSVHPDLSGYFLAVVGRLRPRWVVRENVPAPTMDHFDAALAALGYGTVVMRLDAATLTGQSRQRDFIVGRYQWSREELRRVFPECLDGAGAYTTVFGTRQIVPALTTHRTRYDSRDCYIWEERDGLRILDGDERARLAGFPESWAAEFSAAAIATFYGNAVVPGIVEWIGTHIMSTEVAEVAEVEEEQNT